ncbi:putative dihydrofolate reductase, partial [Chlamydia psittaci 84-8471/1]
MRKRT